MRRFRLLLLSGLLCLVGCGDLLSMKQAKSGLDVLPCSPDPSALSKIFAKDVSQEIGCLGRSLKVFIRTVKTDRPGSLSYERLNGFIDKHVSGVGPEIQKSLRAVFEINSVITGDDTLYIQEKNIEKLTDLLSLVNNTMVENKVYHYFTSEEPLEYREHSARKAAIFNAFVSIREALNEIYKDNDNSIDLYSLIESFKSEENKDILESSQKMLFLKRTFLGGQNQSLKSKELKRFISMIADLSKIVYDVLYLPEITDQRALRVDVMESLKEDIEGLSRNLFSGVSNNEVAFNLDHALEAMDQIMPDSDIFKYRPVIINAKKIFLGNPSPDFTAKEVGLLLNDIIIKNLKRGIYFYKAYEKNAHILNGKYPIIWELNRLPTTNLHDEEFKRDFKRIAKNYWFFLDKDLVATYDNGLERSAWGMFLTATLEDLIQYLFVYYGSKDDSVFGGHKVSQANVLRLLNDFKEFLNDQGLILPGREESAAETITLMAGLFQKQSDGDSDLELQEIVELVTSMITGHKLSSIFYDELSSGVCDVDSKGRFEAQCVRDNFSQFFKMGPGGDKTFGHYYPGLYKYVLSMNSNEAQSFMTNVEAYARTCTKFANGEEVPVTKGDLFMVFTGLLNMESTFTRFNRSANIFVKPNDVLDPKELVKAFDEVYKEAIKARIPGFKIFKTVSVEPLDFKAKDVFFFLLENGKEPGIEMVKILFFGQKKRPANRNSIAKVLKVISEGSEANKNSTFSCESLK